MTADNKVHCSYHILLWANNDCIRSILFLDIESNGYQFGPCNRLHTTAAKSIQSGLWAVIGGLVGGGRGSGGLGRLHGRGNT